MLRIDGNHTLQLALDNEQYSRKNAIRVFGLAVPESRKDFENCKKTICDKLNESQLGVHLSELNFSVAHRVGKVNNGKQAILACFYDRDLQRTVIRARKKLKGTGISIAEDLSEANVRLLNRLQSDEYKIFIDSAWAWNGKIKCKAKGSGTIIQVKFLDSKKDIERFFSLGRRIEKRW